MATIGSISSYPPTSYVQQSIERQRAQELQAQQQQQAQLSEPLQAQALDALNALNDPDAQQQQQRLDAIQVQDLAARTLAARQQEALDLARFQEQQVSGSQLQNGLLQNPLQAQQFRQLGQAYQSQAEQFQEQLQNTQFQAERFAPLTISNLGYNGVDRIDLSNAAQAQNLGVSATDTSNQLP